MVTASEDFTARIWDAASGVELAKLEGHTGSVYATSFSADGTRVVTASSDSTARIWAVDAELLQVFIRDRTSLCLDSAFRENVLFEAPEVAQRTFEACCRCLEDFRQARSVASADGGVQALRDYKRCVKQGAES